MISAIVYTSNTGTTAEYAQLLGEKTGLPVYALDKASGNVQRQCDIIYMGWIKASEVKDYKKAKARYKVCAVIGVGMSGTGTQIEDLQEKNNFDPSLPVFTLQGGFDLNKLTGVNKMMMKIMSKAVIKSLEEKKKLTRDEKIMQNMLVNGGSCVSEKNLEDVLVWFNKTKETL